MKLHRSSVIGGAVGFIFAVFVVWYLNLPPMLVNAVGTQPAAKVIEPLAPEDLAAVERISRVFNHVAQTVNGSVVHIQSLTEAKMVNPGSEFFEAPDLPFRFRRPPGMPSPPRIGLGSGVIIGSDGYVVTNYHVVRDAKIKVILSDGQSYEPEWVHIDPPTDLALIKIPVRGLSALEFADSDEVKVGDIVLAVGNPFGLDNTVTQGIISYLGRGQSYYSSYIQTDAAINPGNSGGPLVSVQGKIIGINTLIVTRTASFAGIGLAIPANRAKFVTDVLKTSEKVIRSYLGIGLNQNFNLPLARTFGLNSAEGALVDRVMENSPASKAGLQVGDVILMLNGSKVKDGLELQRIVSQSLPGKEVKVELWREGKAMTFTVQLDEMPQNFFETGSDEEPFVEQAPGEVKLTSLGIAVATLDNDLAEQFNQHGYKGAVVLDIEPNSEAARLGLQVGDLITKAQNQDIRTAEELAEAVKGRAAEGGIRLYVRSPKGQTRFIFVPIK